ncbi:hypothetical protein EON63_21875 [archaeon]|nr:MAG: hypothetical protein EON63_21875 [archaeon]
MDDRDSKGVSITFLAVVNIVKLRSTLLCCGPNERTLAEAAFPNGIFHATQFEPTLMDLGSLVSRKKDFIPAVSNAIKKGWSNAPAGQIHKSNSDVFDFSQYQDSSLTLNRE